MSKRLLERLKSWSEPWTATTTLEDVDLVGSGTVLTALLCGLPSTLRTSRTWGVTSMTILDLMIGRMSTSMNLTTGSIHQSRQSCSSYGTIWEYLTANLSSFLVCSLSLSGLMLTQMQWLRLCQLIPRLNSYLPSVTLQHPTIETCRSISKLLDGLISLSTSFHYWNLGYAMYMRNCRARQTLSQASPLTMWSKRI